MGLAHSPRITTDGLIFALDSGNDKSYKGPAIQNFLNQINNNNSSGAGKSITSGTENVFIPQLGTQTVKFSSIQNNYPAVSADCCPSPFTFSLGFNVTPSTLYTYGIVYKVESGYTNSNYMYRYEYTASGGTYVAEGGVHNASNRIHLGDGWYWAWGTFTTQATTNYIGYCGAFYYRYSTTADKLYVAKVLLTAGNFTALHPRYWPDFNTTRSNTNVLYGLTNSSTITASSLTYASDGSYSFDGSTNYITTPNTGFAHGTSNFTYNCWVKFSSKPGLGTIFENGSWTNCLLLRFETNGITVYSMASYYGKFTFDPTLNVWYNLTFVRSGNTINFYINGVFSSSLSFGTNLNIVPSPSNMYIGMSQHSAGQCFAGKIDIAQVYTKDLTASEIQQNFNALRGRFGI
jgi:hypothetical protein